MSAIFGVVHWDGRPVAADDLARMDASLAAYGVDGSSQRFASWSQMTGWLRQIDGLQSAA